MTKVPTVVFESIEATGPEIRRLARGAVDLEADVNNPLDGAILTWFDGESFATMRVTRGMYLEVAPNEVKVVATQLPLADPTQGHVLGRFGYEPEDVPPAETPGAVAPYVPTETGGSPPVQSQADTSGEGLVTVPSPAEGLGHDEEVTKATPVKKAAHRKGTK